jgi:hypothetical protein
MRSEPKICGVNTGQLNPCFYMQVYISTSKSDLRLFWRGRNAALRVGCLDRPNENGLIDEQVARDFSAVFVDCSLAAYDFLIGGEALSPASEHVCANFGTVTVRRKPDAIVYYCGRISEVVII